MPIILNFSKKVWYIYNLVNFIKYTRYKLSIIMKKLLYSSIFVAVTTFSCVSAQKITDGESLDVNGLSVTFNILNKEAITVGGKNSTAIKYLQNW